MEVKAEVIYESGSGDIINRYIVFCKVFNEQTRQHGLTREAVAETIRVCRDRGVLREYLAEREKEVVTIMMSLFDEEQIMKSYVRRERREAAYDEARATAKRMIMDRELPLEKIAKYFPSLSMDELKEIEAEVMELV